ncbi:MAG: flagellar biosynthesis protein FlhB [Cellulosilyticaceae bacterium]
MKNNILEKVHVYSIDLQFFASADSEGRTEKGTAKKRTDVRKKGQVAKSAELNTAAILITFFAMMTFLGGYYLKNMEKSVHDVFDLIPTLVNEPNSWMILEVVANATKQIIVMNLPLWAALFAVALIISIIQVGFKMTFSPMAPKFSKMNPLKGIKKIASKDMLVELIKSLGKVIFLGYIFLDVIKDEIPIFLKYYDFTMAQILANIGSVIIKIGFNVGGAFLFLAVADYAYQKYKFEDSIKMTKQELKDEYKQSEGDPQVKGQIKQKMREMSLKRMMQAIPEADVIITNPTHFAIAIAYKPEKNAAPMVVAKGVDYMAQKIKEKAKENSIQIVENKPLARALYYTVDLDHEIPPELYNAVAEVLAFVYNLEKKYK